MASTSDEPLMCLTTTVPTLVFIGTTGGLAILLLLIATCWIVSQMCLTTTVPTLVFMGTTGGLAILLLLIATCWIVSRIRRRLSTKPVPQKEVTHTYLDMTRSIQRSNDLHQGASLAASLSRPLPSTQQQDKGTGDTTYQSPVTCYDSYESIPTTKTEVHYESATDVVPPKGPKCHYENAPDTFRSGYLDTNTIAKGVVSVGDVDQDECGYVLPTSSLRVPSSVRRTGDPSHPTLTFDEDGYLDPRK